MTSLTSKHYDFISKQAAFDKLYGIKRDFSDFAPEQDGRKRKAVIRQLWDEGLVEPRDKNYITTDVAYNRVTSEPFDVMAAWGKELATSQHTFQDFDPRYDVIIASWINNPAYIKWLVNHKDELQWYVLDETPRKYSAARYSGIAGIQEKIDPGCRWYGPMTLEEAQITLQNWFKTAPSLDRTSVPVLGFNTKELVEIAKVARNENQIKKLIITNLGWGLHQLDILTENEAEKIKASEPGALSFFSPGINLGEKPEVWDSKLFENIERYEKMIQTANENITILLKIKNGVNTLGGWNKFRDELRKRLEQELSKKEQPMW